MAADDAQLNACCEGPRSWYVEDDDELREAFSPAQIEHVTSGAAEYMQYSGGGHHKYEEGSLAVGHAAPSCEVRRVVDGALDEAVELESLFDRGRPCVLDFGSFS